MKSMFCKSAALILTLSLAMGLTPAHAQDEATRAAPLLEVTGEGSVSAVPDMATIRLGVVAEAVIAGEAVSAMEGPMTALLGRLQSLGIDPRDIQTSTLRLSPVYADRPPEGDGAPRIERYEASSDVSVQVRDLDLLGAILDEAVGAGSNRFDGLSFGLADPTEVRDAALAAAMADALRKAAILADAAGVQLGPLVRVVEQGGSRPPQPMMMETTMDRSAAVAPGEVETDARVMVQFALQP
ncbi:SIMPL domain-containing protein [Maribius pontilimi]|uniref:SIMPL domain-containing protein n=1 Tax=Palleronia pontilimi TaxID=1964209 RepID=A0A934M935_9RHOB|nr:SIMPL domain-containing protein [Palleronia pontilimi]MBJ3762092.1 SIMPL domain-containing protein [Palleronia pontilimi]